MREGVWALLDAVHRERGNAADTRRVWDAFVLAHRLHRYQRRSSGEPYITHPLEVATILARQRMDVASIITALLHDTVEDTDATSELLAEEFAPVGLQATVLGVATSAQTAGALIATLGWSELISVAGMRAAFAAAVALFAIASTPLLLTLPIDHGPTCRRAWSRLLRSDGRLLTRAVGRSDDAVAPRGAPELRPENLVAARATEGATNAWDEMIRWAGNQQGTPLACARAAARTSIAPRSGSCRPARCRNATPPPTRNRPP